ncbi:unnamed protein product [Tilletia controversa]|nr:unnamed protein product [Tilletia controversa]
MTYEAEVGRSEGLIKSIITFESTINRPHVPSCTTTAAATTTTPSTVTTTAAAMSSDSYRDAKEAFVSDLTGSSATTINAVSLTAATTYALWAVLRVSTPTPPQTPQHALIIEIITLILPLALATTALAHHPLTLNLIITAIAAAVYFTRPSNTHSKKLHSDDDDHHAQPYVDEDKLRGVSSTASVGGEEGRRSVSLRRRPGLSSQPQQQSTAVTSAFQLARQGAVPSTVTQHALAAFHTMQQQNQQNEQQEDSGTFTPIPPTPPPEPSLPPPQQRRTRRKHTRHWSQAYLHSDNSDDEDQDQIQSAQPSPSRLALNDDSHPNTADEQIAPNARPPAAGRALTPQESEPFRVSVESTTDVQPPTPYLSPDDLRLRLRRQQQQEEQDGKRERVVVFLDPTERAVRKLLPVKPFLTVYRAHMMLMTIICILAVDFPVFPRAFAKCETWGTSLMDMGVGSFVFSLGLVSAGPPLRRTILRAINLRQRQPHSHSHSPSSPSSSDHHHQHQQPRLLHQLIQDMRRSLPILLLGLVRVLLVKSTEYPEHTSEYGMHWNFFITLGLLPFVGTLVQAGLFGGGGGGGGGAGRGRGRAKNGRVIGVALILGAGFQLVLWSTPLQEWAISNDLDRKEAGLLAANKEGLVSFAGYVVIYLLGLDLGAYVLPADPYLAHRLRSKRKLRSRSERLDDVAAGQEQQQEQQQQQHRRDGSAVSFASAGATAGERERERESGRGAKHRTHGSTTSISSGSGVGGTGTSPLHVHVLRHRPNGSLSRLSTSSDGGLSAILFAPEEEEEGNGDDGVGNGAVGVGRPIARTAPRSHSDKLAMVLFSFASVWWGLYFLLWLLGAKPSRRIANVMYVVWVSAYNTSFLLGYLLVHMLFLEPLERAAFERGDGADAEKGGEEERMRLHGHGHGHGQGLGGSREDRAGQLKAGTTPVLLETLNRHSLPVFLVANVLTGLINLSIKTMYTPDILALLVLALYLAACFGTALALDRYRIRLRF